MPDIEEPPTKKRRVEGIVTPYTLASLDREISPPRRSNAGTPVRQVARDEQRPRLQAHAEAPPEDQREAESCLTSSNPKLLSSPIQLTRIRDLPDSCNVDTVSLKDILCDPLIKECWQFNYLFDLDFVMNNLDPDVKSLVDVKIVHGSWKSDDPNRARIEEAARAYPNVKVIVAHMPEPFGTHHSKMMILLRHDDSAQVIIHTANMISRDWANLCQAVWRSPLLPLLPQPDNQQDSARLSSGAIGTGQRFKFDLLRYLKAYESRTRTLVDHLKLYDFSSIQAALIASTPSRTDIFNSNEAVQTSFGWPGLQQILRQVPHRPNIPNEKASIVLQSSSIATITEKWLSNLFRVLSCGPSPGSPFAMASQQGPKPKFNVMFPTADEIRNSLDGYESGRSIHTKIQSAAQVKQLHLLRPMFTHWSAESSADRSGALGTREALRRRAAPHIKTYIRYASESQTEIEWALMTSANLSQQAWGALPDKNQQVRICSYEIGVVVWPGLYGEGEDEEVKMVPVFGRDVPDTGIEEQLEEGGDSKAKGKRAVMGLRMPYDLPLVPYGKEEVPWCATMAHSIPDWKGLTYEGFGEH